MALAEHKSRPLLHLKNFSLLTDAKGIIKLTPAYDLVCTRLVIPEDPLALSVVGKKDNLDRADWLRFAAYCRLAEKAAVRALETQMAVHDRAIELIDRCFLSQDQKATYKALIADRTARLG